MDNPTSKSVIKKLKSFSRPGELKGMASFGMATDTRLGVRIPELRAMAKEIGKNHTLALDLWKSGIDEARILAALIDEPEKLTEKQMNSWVKDFNSWDVCDQVCMNLFDKTELAWKKVHDWAKRDEEFVKRAAFALLAVLAWHRRDVPDKKLFAYFPLIKKHATDPRNFVRKAVNWALRHIGKRNKNGNKAALKAAYDIQKIDDKTARWVASDAIRELESDAVQRRLKG